MKEAPIEWKGSIMPPLQLAWLTVQGGLSWVGDVSVLSSHNPGTVCQDGSQTPHFGVM